MTSPDMKDNGGDVSLGEEPIAYSSDGKPIFKQEESDYDLRRRIQQGQLEAGIANPGSDSRKRRGTQIRLTDQRMAFIMGRQWGKRGNR